MLYIYINNCNINFFILELLNLWLEIVLQMLIIDINMYLYKIENCVELILIVVM